MNYSQFLIVDPNVRFGKVCISGTRISVGDVLSWMASGMNEEDIIRDFPEVNKLQIRACLACAADQYKEFNLKK